MTGEDVMGLFAIRARGSTADSGWSGDGLEAARRGLPARFEAVAELLAAGRDASVACGVVGRELARDGADLGEALSDLAKTCAAVVGAEPTFADLQALSVAWGEETLGYLHQLSCEDPLTGLVSLAYLRTRLAEAYRGAERRGERVADRFGLMVIDAPRFARPLSRQERFGRAFAMVRLVELVRQVFPGEESVARVHESRIVVLVAKDPLTGSRAGLLRDRLHADAQSGSAVSDSTRVWLEPLPPTNQGVAWLLDEITRQ